MSWKTIKIKNVCQINSTNISSGFSGIINYYDISSVGSGTISGIQKISYKDAPSRAKRRVVSGDSIIATVRPGNKSYYYFNVALPNDVVSTGFATLHPLECIDSRFLYYCITTDEFIKYLVANERGATYPAVDVNIVENGLIPLPPLEIQHRIADILSAYDNLIENNQKQIKLLEEAAQRLYKEWFVDLHFPGYEDTKIVDGVPEGWRKESVGNIIGRVTRSKQVKTSEYLPKGNIPIIDQSRDFIAGYTNDNETRIDMDCPIIVFGDHTRILKYILFPFAKGADGTQLIISNNITMPQSLLYCSLIAVDLSNYHYARHFKYLKAETILVPIEDIAKQFDGFVAPLFFEIQRLRDSSHKCEEARDRLLPKLMSGELEV